MTCLRSRAPDATWLYVASGVPKNHTRLKGFLAAFPNVIMRDDLDAGLIQHITKAGVDFVAANEQVAFLALTSLTSAHQLRMPLWSRAPFTGHGHFVDHMRMRSTWLARLDSSSGCVSRRSGESDAAHKHVSTQTCTRTESHS